jgi:hypothetical protein
MLLSCLAKNKYHALSYNLNLDKNWSILGFISGTDNAKAGTSLNPQPFSTSLDSCGLSVAAGPWPNDNTNCVNLHYTLVQLLLLDVFTSFKCVKLSTYIMVLAA